MMDSGYWTLIETGGNQSYIFSTNKRRANVGASELIHRVGTQWAREAITTVLEEPEAKANGWQADPVVCASGKALILASHSECGRAIVSEITSRALREAPGLGVWGVVASETVDTTHDEAGGCTCAGCQLAKVHEFHATVRQRAGTPLSRFPTLPFHQPCPFTGAPAAALGREVAGEALLPMSASFHAAFRMGASSQPNAPGPAMSRLRDTVCGETTHVKDACPVQTDLDPKRTPGAQRLDPVRNDGWIAVIHADGNGIGQLFIDIGRRYGTAAPTRLGEFSLALNDVTIAAAKSAAKATAQVTADRRRATSHNPTYPTQWLLPIIVGGDDLTVVCDGRMALDFTATFLAEFQQQAAQNESLAQLVNDLRGPDGPPITASAGIAFIKPHHPFSDGYELAEQLCTSAKRLARTHTEYGALDLHVLFDSVGRDLDAIRAALRVTTPAGESLRLWSGPVSVRPAGLSARADTPEPPTVADLLHAAQALTPASDDDQVGTISRSAAHSLRTALLRGGSAIDETRARVVLRADDPTAATRALEGYFVARAQAFPGDTDWCSYAIDALALGEVLDEQPLAANEGADA